MYPRADNRAYCVVTNALGEQPGGSTRSRRSLANDRRVIGLTGAAPLFRFRQGRLQAELLAAVGRQEQPEHTGLCNCQHARATATHVLW